MSRYSRFRLCVLLFFCFVGITQSAAASTIMGAIYDNQRNGLVDVDVELLDDYYRQIARTRTTAGGRYEFGGLVDGRYTVKVMAFRTDFMDQSAMVEINTSTLKGSMGNQFFTQDFYLVPKKGSLAETELSVVFVQEVPKDAQKTYETAVGNLSKKKADEGIAGLREAVRIFPKYYLALNRLGRELIVKKEYGEAAQLFIRSSEVNPKSPMSFYYLGYALSELNFNKAALVALNQALTLAPASIQVLALLGNRERLEGSFEIAEKHLLQAKKLSKTDNPDIHWELAQLYGNNMKKYKEAAEELELYLKAGRFDDAQIKKVKKIISDLKEKAKNSPSS